MHQLFYSLYRGEREREERNLDKYAHPLEPRIHETNKRYVHMSLPHLHALSAINPQPSAPRKALKAPSKALLKPRKALSKPPEDRCRVAEHRSLEYRPCCQNLGPNEPLRGLRVQGLGLGFGVWGLGFRDSGLGNLGLGFRD